MSEEVLINVRRVATNLSRLEVCDGLRQFFCRINLCNAVDGKFSVTKELKELRYQLPSKKQLEIGVPGKEWARSSKYVQPVDSQPLR